MPVTGHLSFGNGVAQVLAVGQKSKIRFAYTWVDGDTWVAQFTSTLTGDFTVGKGNIAGQTFTSIGKLRDRVYLGFGSTFALSAVGDVTLWEEQNPGAATINYLSQFGVQDSVMAFASLQGRLAVFGERSIQMWSVDANPNNLALQQTMDNTGTSDPLSVQSIGDLDVLYLDSSGVRSLRAKESTLNAYINDMGTAIDSLIRTALGNYTPGDACAVVEPTTRQYWLYLDGDIYVLSYYPQSKIAAWSTYQPSYVGSAVTPTDATFNQVSASGTYARYTVVPGAKYYWVKGANETSIAGLDFGITETPSRTNTGGIEFSANTTSARVYGTSGEAPTGTLTRVDAPFVPKKFVVSNGRVYALAANSRIYLYGGTENDTFDRSRLRAELPWLNLALPSMAKQYEGIDVAMTGRWEVYMSANPRATTLTKVLYRGSDSSPSMVEDSTFDLGNFSFSGNGTHVKIRAESYDDTEAKLGKLVVKYADGPVK